MGYEWPLVLRDLDESKLAVGVKGIPLNAELCDVLGSRGPQVELRGVCTRGHGSTGCVLRCSVRCFVVPDVGMT